MRALKVISEILAVPAGRDPEGWPGVGQLRLASRELSPRPRVPRRRRRLGAAPTPPNRTRCAATTRVQRHLSGEPSAAAAAVTGRPPSNKQTNNGGCGFLLKILGRRLKRPMQHGFGRSSGRSVSIKSKRRAAPPRDDVADSQAGHSSRDGATVIGRGSSCGASSGPHPARLPRDRPDAEDPLTVPPRVGLHRWD